MPDEGDGRAMLPQMVECRVSGTPIDSELTPDTFSSRGSVNKDSRMRAFCQILQPCCGFAVFCAVFFSWLFTLSFVNRITIYRTQHQYKPATFVVKAAVYFRGDESGDSYWLEGTVFGQQERFVPDLAGVAFVHRPETLTLRYPPGTNIPVLYNPEATRTIVQNESLRVLDASPDVWEREAKLRRRLGMFVLLPVPTTLAIYMALRYVNRKQREK